DGDAFRLHRLPAVWNCSVVKHSGWIDKELYNYHHEYRLSKANRISTGSISNKIDGGFLVSPTHISGCVGDLCVGDAWLSISNVPVVTNINFDSIHGDGRHGLFVGSNWCLLQRYEGYGTSSGHGWNIFAANFLLAIVGPRPF